MLLPSVCACCDHDNLKNQHFPFWCMATSSHNKGPYVKLGCQVKISNILTGHSNLLSKLCFQIFISTGTKSVVSSYDWSGRRLICGGQSHRWPAPLALPLSLVVDEIAPSTHKYPSLCATSNEPKRKVNK